MIDPLILARGIHIGASLFAAGTVAFVVLVAEPAARSVGAPQDFPMLRRRLTHTIWIALAMTMLSGIWWLVLLASDIFGASIAEVCLQGGAWSVLTDTRFGLVWSARALLGVSLGVLMLWPASRALQLVYAAGLVALIGLIGHSGATPGLAGGAHLVSDMVHLVAATAWLGALPALAMLLAQARSDTPLGEFAAVATRKFSRLGLIAVAALLASGLLNSWNLLSGPRDLVATDYGRLVLLKIGLFAAMVAIAAVNKFHLTPRLPGTAALRALQRNSLAEIGLGIFVLLFVGALGTLPPAAHLHRSSTEIPPGAAFVHIHNPTAMADVTIDPGRAGSVTATIRVTHEDSTPFPAKTVTLALDPPAAGGKAIERAMRLNTDGKWQADGLDIPTSGIWTLRVIVTPEAGPPLVLDAPIVIER